MVKISIIWWKIRHYNSSINGSNKFWHCRFTRYLFILKEVVSGYCGIWVPGWWHLFCFLPDQHLPSTQIIQRVPAPMLTPSNRKSNPIHYHNFMHAVSQRLVLFRNWNRSTIYAFRCNDLDNIFLNQILKGKVEIEQNIGKRGLKQNLIFLSIFLSIIFFIMTTQSIYFCLI
jgi:hypothetical protein